ncbi:Cys/Met metabolism pyridoxal phosphate-dependent enzyme [Penicillium sp. DV-2018c]|nr:Cys/Met metabolism pyridoxal phosphate-dependent enzyme [Penicillium sp. DV-2018c]
MSLFRPAQQDLTLSLADNLTRPEVATQLTTLLEKITAKPMIRRFDFATMQGTSAFNFDIYVPFAKFPADLHEFEAAVTGFRVLYDG